MVKLIACISWRSNFEYPQDVTIHAALKFAEEGLDSGPRGCFMIMPTEQENIIEHVLWEIYILQMINKLPVDLSRK